MGVQWEIQLGLVESDLRRFECCVHGLSLSVVLSSENCAAVSWSEIIDELWLMEGIPWDHNTEDILRDAVIRRSDDMAFLATLTIDDLEGLLNGSLSFLVSHSLHRVNRAYERVFASFRVRKFSWVRSGLVGDQCADLARLVWMSLLEHCQTQKLVWRKVVIQPLERVHGKLRPVTISSSNHMGASIWMTHLIGVPCCLATGRTDILGCARNWNDIRLTVLDHERIRRGLLLFPWLLVVEGVELDIVDWACTIDNWSLAIKDCQHLVAFFDVVLIRSDGYDLVPGQLIVPDPFLQLFWISHCISTLEDHDIRISARSTVLDHRQEFKLINDT